MELKLPKVTGKKKRKIYHAGCVDLSNAAELGWEPIDVRLMPNETDDQRRDAVRATLEGIRFGTISADNKQLRALELEARVLGMIGSKAGHDDGHGDMDDEDVNALLSRGSSKH